MDEWWFDEDKDMGNKQLKKFINVDKDDYMVYDDMIGNIKAIVIELADLRVKLEVLKNRLDVMQNELHEM